jgi:DNA invertase Pin-like site-specific DNA recombinase
MAAYAKSPRRDPATTGRRANRAYAPRSDFPLNALDAQREACSATIASQRAEGWVEHPASYDDGGVSGGTLERPALRRLLADIEARRIDVVVVYKIDRLSRALIDFAKLIEEFDRSDVTFVSVTQSFNTTTSMGRLTLDILLSFARVECEVIGGATSADSISHRPGRHRPARRGRFEGRNQRLSRGSGFRSFFPIDPSRARASRWHRVRAAAYGNGAPLAMAA